MIVRSISRHRLQINTNLYWTQGVVEEATVKATHEKDWLVLPASGEEVEFETAIFFPWI